MPRDLLQADVLDEHLQEMPHLDGPRCIRQPSRGERSVDGVRERPAVTDISIGPGQVDEAGAAGSDERAGAVALAFGEGQVACHQRMSAQRVQAHELRGAATIPVIDFGQLDAKVRQDGRQRGAIGSTARVHRTARVIQESLSRRRGGGLGIVGLGGRKGDGHGLAPVAAGAVASVSASVEAGRRPLANSSALAMMARSPATSRIR